jgi:hypothetical protein
VHTDGAAVAAVTPVHSGLVTAGSVLGAAILAGVLGAAAVPAALGRRRA